MDSIDEKIDNYYNKSKMLGKTQLKINRDNNKVSIVCIDKEIEEIIIPNFVTHIEDKAFKGCNKLKSVVLSKGLKAIGEEAFANCINLQSIELPETLEILGVHSFYNCKSIKEINIPERIKEIPSFCFYSCIGMRNIILNYGIEEIDTMAFAYTGLETLIMPRSIKKIHNYSFCFCARLSKIYMDTKDVLIENSAFDGSTDIIELSELCER